MADAISEISVYEPSKLHEDLQQSCLAHLIYIADIQYQQIFNECKTDDDRKHARDRKNRLFDLFRISDFNTLGDFKKNVDLATCYFMNPRDTCETATKWFSDQERLRETAAKEGGDAAQTPGNDAEKALQAEPTTSAMEASPSHSRPSTREGEEAVAPSSAPAPGGGEDRGTEPMQVDVEASQAVSSEQKFTINVKKLISRLTDLGVLERLLNMNCQRDPNYVKIQLPE